MKKNIIILIIMLPVFASGCLIQNIYPIYCEEETIKDDQILGCWVTPMDLWEFVDDGDGYRLTYTTEDRRVGTFDVHLALIEGNLMLDVLPIEQPLTYWDGSSWSMDQPLFLISDHAFFVIDSLEPEKIALRALNPTRFEDFFTRDQLVNPEPDIEKAEFAVLALSTEEFRQIILETLEIPFTPYDPEVQNNDDTWIPFNLKKINRDEIPDEWWVEGEPDKLRER